MPAMNTRSQQPVVMIVASHPILRNAILESLLLMQPDWVHLEAKSVAHALQLAASSVIDLALVDANLANADSTDVVRQIRSMAPKTHVVIMTDADFDLAPTLYMDAGAIATVRKRNLFAELGQLLPTLFATGIAS